MLHVGLLALLLLPQNVRGPTQEVTPPATAPTTQPTYDTGPLRVAFVAMRELRFGRMEPTAFPGMESELRFQVRLQGERIDQITRSSDFLLDEIVDDTGQSLIEQPVTEAERDRTAPMVITAERLRARGLELMIKTKPAARGARRLTRIRGTVHVILADKTEKVTIDNPFQYLGKLIEHPRFKELGLEIRVVPFDELPEPPPPGTIILQYKTKANHVQQVQAFDGSLRPTSVRDKASTTTAGAECVEYSIDPAVFTNELQLVFTVHPEIEDRRIPGELDNFELP